MHETSDLPPLARLALIHYQFEAIHPFLDGNGRVGRLLLTLLLCQWRVLPQPLLYLSAFFESNRDAYYDLLLRVSREGRWTDWTAFFLRGVEVQSKDAVLRIRRLQQLEQGYRQKLQTGRVSGIILGLVDLLFTTPAITAGMAKERLHITFKSAQRNIDKLIELDILKEVTGRARNRIFVAEEILEAIDMPLEVERDE